jgi:hypothetical protein
MIETFLWQPQWGPDDVVVWVNVEKADRAWQRDADYYIGPDAADSEYKYRNFGDWLKANPTRSGCRT